VVCHQLDRRPHTRCVRIQPSIAVCLTLISLNFRNAAPRHRTTSSPARVSSASFCEPNASPRQLMRNGPLRGARNARLLMARAYSSGLRSIYCSTVFSCSLVSGPTTRGPYLTGTLKPTPAGQAENRFPLKVAPNFRTCPVRYAPDLLGFGLRAVRPRWSRSAT